MKRRIFSLLLAICLMTGMLAMTAGAEEASQVFVKLAWGESDGVEWILNAGETKYATTDADGKVTVLDSATDNYNIKVENPTTGTPTIYLKGATIKAVPTGFNSSDSKNPIAIGKAAKKDGDGNILVPAINAFSMNVKVESDSTLTTTNGTPLASSITGTLTITGPGKLTAVSDHMGYGMSVSNELVLKDAKVDITSKIATNQGVRPGLKMANGNLTVDNTELTIHTNSGPSIYISDSHYEMKGEAYDITIRNGSKLKLTNVNSNLAAVSCMGEITFDSSEIEITSKAKCFSPKPILTGVGAVGGTKPANAKAYNEKKAASYTYFKCGADLEVPTEPTTQATQPTTPATEATTPATQATTPATQATTPAGTQATKPATQATSPATQATQSGAQTTTPVNTPDADDGTDGGSNVLLYVVLAVLVAAVIAVPTIFLLLKKKNADDADTEEAEEAAEEAPEETPEGTTEE